MSADVEMKPLVSRGARNAAYVNRIRFQDRDVDVVLGEQIGRGETRRSGSDDCYIGFHYS